MPGSGCLLAQPPFLPTTPAECEALGWGAIDVLLVSGDAYVDHPSFGVALLGRWLVAHGFRTGIVAQPRYGNREEALHDVSLMGRPRLFAGVTAGAIDSMLAHYTAFRKKRHDDAYTPGGKAGARPNRAAIFYTGLLRQAFPGIPVVLGGIEASLRRAVHYDFWADAVKRPLLFDSKADAIVYGMGESALLALAQGAERIADSGAQVTREAFAAACASVPGLARFARPEEMAVPPEHCAIMPSYEDILARPGALLDASLLMEKQVHDAAYPVLQNCEGRAVFFTPPASPLSEAAMDSLYALPYSRLPHPAYKEPIPAWEMIRTSITTHRGCGGGCSFCSLAIHQGRRIASRSRASVLAEAAHIAKGPRALPVSGENRSGLPAKAPKWAGSISDVGGPSANMWRARCALTDKKPDARCKRASCMHPAICPFFVVNQSEGAELLSDIAELPGVRHVRIASGVRFDLALKDPAALYAYTAKFTGGQLKVAPEHSEDAVLALMRKPGMEVFERFLAEFGRLSGQAQKEQYTVPYLMSAFPGCEARHMKALGAWLAAKGWSPKQVQCFIPTPGTVATAMFYSGLAPDGTAIYVARSDKERLMQHHLLLGPRAEGDSRRKGFDRRTNASASSGAKRQGARHDGGRGGSRGGSHEGKGREGRGKR